MLAEMTGDHLREWQEYFECEPFGGPHEDLRFGLLLNLMYDANRDPKKSKTMHVWDWFPHLKPAEKPQGQWDTIEGQHELAKIWCALLGDGKVKG